MNKTNPTKYSENRFFVLKKTEIYFYADVSGLNPKVNWLPRNTMYLAIGKVGGTYRLWDCDKNFKFVGGTILYSIEECKKEAKKLFYGNIDWIISISALKTISQTGIEFIDGSFINFSDCVKNNGMGENSKCAAVRDITADPPYIQFFAAERPIRIVFGKRGIFAKNKEAFTKLQLQIEKYGYSTYDLS